ncbi:MAG TPA: serine hydrolase [Blastocatellia bacterium]|nr:serine hydrolase [Blastocatellia bacterium]
MNASLAGQLDHLFKDWDNAESPGCALAIYQDGETVYERGYGMAHLEHQARITPATVFHIASLSKQFTAMAMALLARSGRISLEDDLREYVPEMRVGVPITFRQIIHHISGLRDQWDMLRLAGWRENDVKMNADVLRLATAQQEMNFAPGTRFQYVNTGYTLMGIVIKRVTGQSLRQYADEQIFKPLGMQSTFFQDNYREIIQHRAQAYSRRDGRLQIDVPNYETVGPTGLFSTVEDFARWERNFLKPTVGDDDFIGQLMTPGVLADGQPISYGFGLLVGKYRGLDTVEHAGGDAGYRAYYLRIPSQRWAVAIFANFSEVEPGPLAHQVADLCLAGRFKEDAADDHQEVRVWAGRAAGVQTPLALDLGGKAGRYRDDYSGMTCEIETRGGRIFLVAGTGGEYELLSVAENHLGFLNRDAECLFTPATGDQPVHMTVKYAGQVTAECDRLGDNQPPPEWRAETYVGTYESAELDVRYMIEGKGSEMVLQRAKFAPSPLSVISEDEFAASDEGLHLRFERGTDGRVTGMILSAERVWNVRFARL